jgi:hypothetical protein
MKHTRLIAIAATVAALAGAGAWLWTPAATGAAAAIAVPASLPGARLHRTAHYTISSTATPAQTQQVGAAVEALHAAWLRHFGVAGAGSRLHLVLYRDRAQFKAHNRSSPWAEAFYRNPACHAYVADGANPYHWMLHEATHQLGTQVAGLPRRRWIDEGVASYFGASRISEGVLVPGTFGADAYPIWWLSSVELDADVDKDIAAGRFIPLRALITDTGPDISRHVNQYYVQYWSLTHFLFHYQEGRHAQAYRELIASGGGLEEFQRRIGPVDAVQREWHAYLRALAQAQRERQAAEADADGAVEASLL